jgi:DNA-binding MarR family transcriptional regulator
MTLKDELGLRADFKNRDHEALLNIYFSASKAKKRADEFFRAHGITDVQFNVMILLKNQSGKRGGLTQIELSEMMLVNRANITTLIDRMEKAGFVVRVPDSEDRRYNIVKLTRTGIARHAQVAARYMEQVGDIMGALSKGERQTLVELLTRVRSRLDTLAPH